MIIPKTHLSPDGAVLNDEGGFVLPDTITANTIINLGRKLFKEYREPIPLSEWLKKPTLFGLPIIESENIKDIGEINFGDLSEYIRCRKED
jgi:hypothetical protein